MLSIALQDGRALAYALMGAPIAGAAAVCIYHHGVPASLIEAEPLAAAAAPLGIAVVAFDRPGEHMCLCFANCCNTCTSCLHLWNGLAGA